MGMFDYVKCSYPLPVGDSSMEFQTKDTHAQLCDHYEIRADGTLWHEAYGIEDQSDPTAEGIERIFGCMTRVNERWEPVPNFIGEIVFYYFSKTRWIEYSSYFVNGVLKELHLLKDEQS